MSRGYSIAILLTSVAILLVIFVCVWILVPRGNRPIRTKHGVSSHNLSLNHLPDLPDAHRVEKSIVFPIILFNGGLPLIIIHVGATGSRAAAILDTGSEMLLLADTERCNTCSSELFGGARGSDGQKEGGGGVVKFGSQTDTIEFHKADLLLDNFKVKELLFGLVTHRQSRTKNRTTYNIMGLGGAQTIANAFLNQLHNRLRPGEGRIFGFMLGDTGNDQTDDRGTFVLGPLPTTIFPTNARKLAAEVPLHAKPLSPYFYYTCHVEAVKARLRNGKLLDYQIGQFPVVFDTGSNYTEFPRAMETSFADVESMELYFSQNQKLQLSNEMLMRNRRPSWPLVYFADTNIITVGTLTLSKFQALEFSLDGNPSVKFFER